MNLFLATAAGLSALLGIIHSVMGEKMIFSRLLSAEKIAVLRSVGLGQRQIGILWATWHLASVLAGSLSVVLWYFASFAERDFRNCQLAIGIGFAISSGLVLFGTRGRHPGWVVLAAISGLTLFA